ncbi:hypothetical protein STANM309S_01023 [Streptomyces tanashiensis]
MARTRTPLASCRRSRSSISSGFCRPGVPGCSEAELSCITSVMSSIACWILR